MIKDNTLKGVLLVGLGAASYGVLATFVKIAYNEGYTTAEVSVAQFIVGIIGVLIINFFQKLKSKKGIAKPSQKNIFQLILAGTSLGATSVFYYLSVKYIPVSISIVLLMQTVWMAVLVEMILNKIIPSARKIISVIIALAGTVLATNLFYSNVYLDWHGFLWGILAAVSFTITMYTANRIATEISSAQRSLYMLIGGTIIALLFAFLNMDTPFNFNVFAKWGIILALFGTIIPPLLMNSGFPLTGIALGSIISVIELPVSVIMAYFLLDEEINLGQWLGIILIVGAVVIMNINHKKQ